MEGINTVTNNLLEKTYNCELHTTFNEMIIFFCIYITFIHNEIHIIGKNMF